MRGSPKGGLRSERRRVLLALVVLLAAALVLGLALGSAERATSEILWQIRLPRVLLAALVGAGLASAGALLQPLLHNPLADPYVLGISGGAALGGVLALALGLESGGAALSVPGFAFAGALGATALLWAIAGAGGRAPAHSLLLTGVVFNAFASSLIVFATSLADLSRVAGVFLWLIGSIRLVEPLQIGGVALLLALGLGAGVYHAWALNLLSQGDEVATHLGVDVPRARRALLLAASLMIGASVAVSGLIGFVGLIVPHLLRMIAGADHRLVVPASALLGGSFLVLADTLARTVLAPNELPVGALTALVGGPVFLVLLRRDLVAHAAVRDPALEPALRWPVRAAGEARSAPGAELLGAGGVEFAYAREPVLRGADFLLCAGELSVLVGPNGSGKTTLARLLAGSLAPAAGSVRLRGLPLAGRSRREIARELAVVPQESHVPFPYRVREMVAMGRAPHLGVLGRESSRDRARVAGALAALGIEALAERSYPTLSGGEKQRALLARALAQECDVWLCDEPTAHMDLGHRLHAFEWLRAWIAAAPERRGVALITHDLQLAARFADRLTLLDAGRTVASGSPEEVLTPERIERVYGVEARVERGHDGRLVVDAVRHLKADGTPRR